MWESTSNHSFSNDIYLNASEGIKDLLADGSVSKETLILVSTLRWMVTDEGNVTVNVKLQKW